MADRNIGFPEKCNDLLNLTTHFYLICPSKSTGNLAAPQPGGAVSGRGAGGGRFPLRRGPIFYKMAALLTS